LIGPLRPSPDRWYIFDHLKRGVGNFISPAAAGSKCVGEQCTVAKCGEALRSIVGNGLEIRYLVKGCYLNHAESAARVGRCGYAGPSKKLFQAGIIEVVLAIAQRSDHAPRRHFQTQGAICMRLPDFAKARCFQDFR
jgi:hypothetical protein